MSGAALLAVPVIGPIFGFLWTFRKIVLPIAIAIGLGLYGWHVYSNIKTDAYNSGYNKAKAECTATAWSEYAAKVEAARKHADEGRLATAAENTDLKKQLAEMAAHPTIVRNTIRVPVEKLVKVDSCPLNPNAMAEIRKTINDQRGRVMP